MSGSAADTAAMRPSEFPRPLRFREPGPAFVEDGVTHLRSYRDVKRAMMNSQRNEFTQDVSYWAPPTGERLHLTWYFVWAAGLRRRDGTPGRHAVLRDLIEPWCRTHAVRQLAPTIARLAQSLIDAIVAKGTGEFDLASELAYPLAMRTICALTGLPMQREQWMREQLDVFARAPELDQLQREPLEVEDYFWQLVRHRGAEPGDALLDLLIAAWSDGRISDLELLGNIWGLFHAGTETTAPHLVNVIALLGEFGLLDLARAHADDNEWIDAAGDEALRFTTPFPAGPLLAATEVVLDDGQIIARYSPVRAWFSAANRDRAVNGTNAEAAPPAVFDVGRSPNQHLAFGTGMHHCFGAPLARLETRILLRTALSCLPGLEPDPAKPFRRFAGIVDGVTSAPFRFEQRAAERHAGRLPDRRRGQVWH